jgi:hypothetical protein
VRAIHFVADEGWKLLPLYRFDPASGLWHHERGRALPPLSLHDVSFDSGGLSVPRSVPAVAAGALARHLEEARRIVREVEASPPTAPPPRPNLPDEFERARWFPLPDEAFRELRRNGAPAFRGRRRRATARARFDPAGRPRA